MRLLNNSWKLLCSRFQSVLHDPAEQSGRGCSGRRVVVADVTYSGAWTKRANFSGFSADAKCRRKGRFTAVRSVFQMATKHYLPHYVSGKVISGFGRGSKALGCPTANFSEDVVEALPAEFETGIYYGWASLERQIYKMVMSIGWNPFYKNDKKSMEIHLLHKFEKDFYGKELRVIILGYIRPEMNFSSVDELIEKINSDIEIAKKSLEEPKAIAYKEDPFLSS